MSLNGLARYSLEHDLLEAVLKARGEYQDLHRNYSRLLTDARDMGLIIPDGMSTLARSCDAHRALEHATERYRVALKRFTRLVVYREFPETEQSQE